MVTYADSSFIEKPQRASLKTKRSFHLSN